MNETAQKLFDSIVKKNPRDLTQDELVFLHARRPYLNDEQLKVFGDVLDKYDTEMKLKVVAEDSSKQKPPLYVSKKDKKNG